MRHWIYCPYCAQLSERLEKADYDTWRSLLFRSYSFVVVHETTMQRSFVLLKSFLVLDECDHLLLDHSADFFVGYLLERSDATFFVILVLHEKIYFLSHARHSQIVKP